MPMPSLTIGRIGIGSSESKESWPSEVSNRITEDEQERITEDGQTRVVE